MPKTKKFRDLSRRQQNRRLLLQMKSVTCKQNILHMKDSTHTECTDEDTFNTIGSLNIINEAINEVHSEDDVMDNVLDAENINIDCIIDSTISKEKRTLNEKLCTWATEYNITQRSFTALLHILKEDGHNELPGDARSLLKTPKKTITRECGNGHYFHYGLEKALKDKLQYCTNINNVDVIEININIDGLPLAKSSQSQLWPILGQIYNVSVKDIFLIGAYHGYKKPTNATDLLQEFCEEYRILHTEGILFKNKKYLVTIRAVICDAPAKSFVTATKGHNAYFGCGKCWCEGDYLNHRMVFLDEDAPLRTDINFRNRDNEDHHVSISPFENLPVDMVNNFPLDYMHLICLGVMKRMIQLWIKGHHIYRLRAIAIDSLSTDILTLHKYIPIEFARHTRGINEIDRWKATEFRLFLLYLGPIILDKYLDKVYLKHFCVIHTAVRILCHPEDCLRNNAYANELMTYFVKTFKVLYGESNIVYNVHNLIHLCQDVQNNGCLDTFSAFPFENYMKTLKKMLRKSEKPLSQLNNRIHEYTTRCMHHVNHSTDKPLLLKPDEKTLPLNCTHSHKKIKFEDFVLTCKSPNNCCYLKDGSVLCIKHIGFKNDIPVVLGNKYIDLRSIPTYPCNSQNLNIHMFNGETLNLEVVHLTEIYMKGFKVFFNNMYYVMPLLHLM